MNDDTPVAKASGSRMLVQSPGNFGQTAPWGPPLVLDSGGWVGPGCLHFNRFPGEADAAGPGAPDENHWLNL